MSAFVSVRKVLAGAIIPEYKTPGAVGMDLCAAEEKFVFAGGQRAFRTGLAFSIPEGLEGSIRSRSGLAFNDGIHVVEGTIDQDYRGEVRVLLFNAGRSPFFVHTGDRIAQIVFNLVARVSLKEEEVLEETKRGTNGFGSTGRR